MTVVEDLALDLDEEERLNEEATGVREIDAVELLNDLFAFVRRFVACSDSALDASVLWIVHTHAFEAAECTPRFILSSAEPQSGKSRFLEVFKVLVRKAHFTANISDAALFRLIDAERVTVLFDEVDAIFGAKSNNVREDLRALINAGYERGAVATRCVGEGTNKATKDFKVFAAVALAGLGHLPETIEQRSIRVRLKRRAPGEHVEKFRRRKIGPEAENLRDRTAAWTAQNIQQLTEIMPEMPDGLSDRAEDVWEPLFAIADLVGGDWPVRARQAAVELFSARDTDEGTIGIRLLADIKDVFQDTKSAGLASGVLAGRLAQIEGSPWGEWGSENRPLSASRLTRMLHEKYQIKSDQHKLGGQKIRGFLYTDFEDAWSRYLPPPEISGTDDEVVLPSLNNGSTSTTFHPVPHSPDATSEKPWANPDEVVEKLQATFDAVVISETKPA